MKKFAELSPESQERVRRVAVNLITRHALKSGPSIEQAQAKAKEVIAKVAKPPTKFFEPPTKK